MYLREYSRLYDRINEIDSSDCHATLERSVVSPDLVPSGDNPAVNYWYEQSKRHGADAMYFCMERIFDAAEKGNDLDIAELFSTILFSIRPVLLLRDVEQGGDHEPTNLIAQKLRP